MKSIPIKYFLLLFFWFGSFAQKIDKGIALDLAVWRKKEVSNIKYQLHFNIPTSTQNITVQETIFFDLKDANKPVQIDFKTEEKHIQRLVVNNKNIKEISNNNTMGILICKRENKFVIEYCSDERIVVREYELV